MEVMPDPVHLLLDVDPRIGIDAVARKINGNTAHTIRKEYPWMQSRLPSLWTRSRSIASVGSVSLAVHRGTKRPMIVRKAFKYRIYPNKKQQAALAVQFGHARYIYN